MNWEAIGAIGEIIGAGAVFITLGYIAVQVRQNTRAMKSNAYSSIFDIHLATEQNGKYIALLFKSQRKEQLTPEERALMVERFLTLMKGQERVWYQQQIGVLTEDQFEQQLDLLRWTLSMPQARRMWVHLAHIFDPKFRAVVESRVLAEHAPRSALIGASMAIDRE